jgi:hypothetical protein
MIVNCKSFTLIFLVIVAIIMVPVLSDSSEKQSVVTLKSGKLIFTYPSSTEPYLDYHKYFGDSGTVKKKRWDSDIKITNKGKSNVTINKKARIHYSANGNAYSTKSWKYSGNPLSVADDTTITIKPGKSYVDEQWVRSSVSSCTFCGGRSEYYYWGENERGESFITKIVIKRGK